jgi:hypothetical protein
MPNAQCPMLNAAQLSPKTTHIADTQKRTDSSVLMSSVRSASDAPQSAELSATSYAVIRESSIHHSAKSHGHATRDDVAQSLQVQTEGPEDYSADNLHIFLGRF